jgi:hypothetical protein
VADAECSKTLIFRVIPSENYSFFQTPGKNDPHIRIPAAFPGSGRGKLRGENSIDLRAFGGLLEM